MPFPNEETQFQPGQSGNPAGKPKGALHLSTHIQNMLNDEEFEANVLDAKVGVREYKGAPLKAIIQVAIAKSVNGDDKAREWLAKYGYGQKFELEHSGEIASGEFDPDRAAKFKKFLEEETKQ